MKVATWNIHRGRATFGPRFRPDRIVAVLAAMRPDVIALQEAQHYLRRATPMLDPASLARDCGLRPLMVEGQPGFRGNVLLVRASAREMRPSQGIRLGGWEPRGAILAELDCGAGPIRLLACHLSLTPGRRRAQARLLLEAIQAGPAGPTLLLGDFNEWRPQGSALRALSAAFGPLAAVPSFPSLRPMLALDHIMGLPAGLVRDAAAFDTPAARAASDHLPVVARLVSPPA